MRKIVGLVVAVGLAVGTVGVGSPSMSAASGTVTVKKIADKKVKYGKSASVKPSVTSTGNVTFSSRKITVKKGKKSVAKNKTSVSLKAGTYTVTTTAKYRTWRHAVKHVKTTQVAYTAGTLVPVTCSIVSVGTPASVTTTTYAERCTGEYDGFHAHSGSATYDPVNGVWALDSGTSVAGPTADVLVGHTEAKEITAARDLILTVVVDEPYIARSSLQTKMRTQSLTIKQGKKPTRAEPYSNGECPSWAPIKGNADSMIYHVPGGQYYDVTNAEDCFSTQAAAVAAGYRKSKR